MASVADKNSRGGETRPWSGLAWPRTRTARAIYNELDLVAIYAAGMEGDPRIRIGRTCELSKTLAMLQTDLWRGLELHHHVFVQGDLAARRVHGEIVDILTRSNRALEGRADWYALSPELARATIAVSARKAGVRALTHDAMIALIAEIEEHRVERLCRS